MSKIIYVLSPHTDDAEIAAGGTIAKWVEKNYVVHHRAFSRAIISLPSGIEPDQTEIEFNSAQEVLGTHGMIGDFPTRRFTEHRQDILDQILRDADRIHPDLVVGPSVNDCHQDHRVIAEEMIRAFRRSAEILCYEHPRNEHGFSPHAWCELTSDHVDKKISAIAQYESQEVKQDSFLDLDSILAVLKYRGMQINAHAAEAFEVVRQRI
ncbi:MAG: PIG-L family deacetylase [Candidatus Brocadiales bacterium]|nr:PIG-L family deacetylase [Candidatus Bathyanammoxibius sp.]